MLCPNCGRHVLKEQMVKSNIRGFENVDIIYDITCPYCCTKVGQMSWGNLIMRDDLPEPSRRPLKAERIIDNRLLPPEPPQWVHVCPHCGGDLPDDLTELPIRQRDTERRTRERRTGDRRRAQQPFEGPDRRRGDRRAQNERRGDEPPLGGRREIDRRRVQRPVLYDRRLPGRDRRARTEGDDINRKV